MTIREQTAKHFKDRLEQFCYEFYEFLDIDEETTIADITNAVIEGLNDFHASINKDKISQQLYDSNDNLEPMDYGED